MSMRFYRIFYKFVLSRRYRVTIKGLDFIKSNKGKLILPNHQSHIDPQIIAIEILKYTTVVPVVNANFFKIPVVKHFLNKWGAIAVPKFDNGVKDPRVLHTILKKAKEELANGKSVILYPSGELQDTGLERINNKQGAYRIVRELPEGSKVLGLRVNGLWGSAFSKAWSGKRPSFLPTFLKGVYFFLINLVVFIPKRDVNLEFVDLTAEAKRKSLESKLIFNSFLEEFYNSNGAEKPTFVKHYFFLPKSKRQVPTSILKKNEKIRLENASIR